MRIALVSEHASPLAALGQADAGGQNVYVAELARGLARRGHGVTVHTRRDCRLLPRQVRVLQRFTVDHVDAGPPDVLPKDELLPWMDDFATDLERVWRRDRPDVVHAHFWMSGLAALQAARALDIPVVQTFHALGAEKRREQGPADTSPPERLAMEQRIAQEADLIVATSSLEAFSLAGLGAHPSRVIVVPCGVDHRFFTPGPGMARRNDRPRIVTLSRLVERKGIATVIQALADVPHAELVVAGGPPRQRLASDPERTRLVAIAEAHGVRDRVRFTGGLERSAARDLLRSADVVVSVPWYEPFGIVPVEAMACGVPVIGSAVGGLLDTIQDGVTGVHVPPRNPVLLAAALRRLLADPRERERYGRNGMARARERYAWGIIAARLAASYADVAQPAVVEGSLA